MNHHATVFYKKLKELHPKIRALSRCVQRAGYDFRMIVVRVTGRHRNNVSVTMLHVGWERIPARDLRKLVVSNLHNVISS